MQSKLVELIVSSSAVGEIVYTILNA
ncbi:hypothetical protein CBM2615_B60006 [Cupriavidus taiwanensis]|uniref:Uncharacterized protein n=1 Tax=Cupriavidus taiwanensis TaxID=164546 RepID=A0A976B2H2_9BURK|nr:hypothetical protein CBM2614_B50006 [Cupriavidus taiwanensis]SOZ69643.1 hypothetical protein CBM2615_B60006 [Cupriavidus taiwanensis]SOZ72858.1 hypothetical protein CBM2613_B50006 [Cupriavidus taiwanensis]SPA09717.1 hypothetical protein CBM2625_B50006 [Cupriavidus taiwanensis]